MGNLKDIQDITGLTSEAIFNIRKPIDYMCSDIDSHIKDIRTQCDYIMDGDEEDVKYYSKSIKSDVDSYFEDIRSKVENLRDWGEQWKALAKDLFNELLEIDSDNTIDSYLSYKALDKEKKVAVIRFDTDQPICISTRIMNPSFGVIMDEYGKDIFQGNLKLINVPKGVKDLIVNYIEKYRKL